MVSILPCRIIKEFKSQLNKPISREPKTAVQNPLTSKPGINPETIKSKNAFIINVKRPKLRILMGRVRIKRTGLRKAFSMLKMAAAKKAEKKPLTWMPSIIYDVMRIAHIRIAHRNKRLGIIIISSGVMVKRPLFCAQTPASGK